MTAFRSFRSLICTRGFPLTLLVAVSSLLLVLAFLNQKCNRRKDQTSMDDQQSPLPPSPQQMDAHGIPNWLHVKGKAVRNPFTFCQVLYPTEERPYDKEFAEEMRLHDIEFKKYKWGGDGYVMLCCQQQVRLMIDLARIPWVKTICEVGFNAGHSALTWLAAKPGTKLYSFDIGYHDYVKPLGAYMSKRFPGRFNLTIGNSVESIPKFIKENPDIRCDLISIDGAHNYKYGVQDFDNFRKMANPVNVLHFDDYPSGAPIRQQELGQIWEEKVASDKLVPLLRCSFQTDLKRNLKHEKGFAVGRIVV